MTDYEQIFHDAAEVNISLSAGIAAVVAAAKSEALVDAARAAESCPLGSDDIGYEAATIAEAIRALATVRPAEEIIDGRMADGVFE